MGDTNKEEKIDDIVAMIDQFMSNNGGHMNIQVDASGTVTAEKTVQTTNSLECAAGDMACKVPTLFEGMDLSEDTEEQHDDYNYNHHED